MRRLPGGALLAASLLAGCASAARPGASLPGIVSTDTLAAWLGMGPISLIDVRTDVSTYLKDHLPGLDAIRVLQLVDLHDRVDRGAVQAGDVAQVLAALDHVLERRRLGRDLRGGSRGAARLLGRRVGWARRGRRNRRSQAAERRW